MNIVGVYFYGAHVIELQDH